MLGLSYSVMVTQRFLVPHFLVRVRVGQPTERQPFTGLTLLLSHGIDNAQCTICNFQDWCGYLLNMNYPRIIHEFFMCDSLNQIING